MLELVDPIWTGGWLDGGARQTGAIKAGLQAGAVRHHAKADERGWASAGYHQPVGDFNPPEPDRTSRKCEVGH